MKSNSPKCRRAHCWNYVSVNISTLKAICSSSASSPICETTRRNWNFSCKLVFVFDYPYIFTGQIHIGNSSYRRPNTFLLWLHPTEATCFFMFSVEQCHFPQSHSLSSSLPFCEFSILFPLQVSIQEPKNREGRYATHCLVIGKGKS